LKLLTYANLCFTGRGSKLDVDGKQERRQQQQT
jgi:hypothetical protein